MSSLQTPAHPSCSSSAVPPAGSPILWVAAVLRLVLAPRAERLLDMAAHNLQEQGGVCRRPSGPGPGTVQSECAGNTGLRLASGWTSPCHLLSPCTPAAGGTSVPGGCLANAGPVGKGGSMEGE